MSSTIWSKESEASPLFPFYRSVNRVQSSRETNDYIHATVRMQLVPRSTWTLSYSRCKSVKGGEAIYCFLTVFGWMIYYIVCVASHGACLASAMIMGYLLPQQSKRRGSCFTCSKRKKGTTLKSGFNHRQAHKSARRKDKKARWEGRQEKKKKKSKGQVGIIKQREAK